MSQDQQVRDLSFASKTTAEIRESFLSFFNEKGCKRVASSSLIPDDPSLLLSNAGMNQFKQYYLGTKTMPEIGACSCQKCLRTNDIEEIGDSSHLSFFEMLGNFSFGGYSKKQACTWAYEFITSKKYLGLPLELLHFTVYTDDDDAFEIWKELGVDPSHITRLGEEDNFWAAGPTGPCGPCSEIYFDLGPEAASSPDDVKPGDGRRFLEFWNLVFTQYDRQEDGTLLDLPHQNIDTGMGLERIASILQKVSSNYDTDVLRSLVAVGERLCAKTYGEDAETDKSLRILADHARAASFMIGDGVLVSNEGRGYVLRRLLRRAIFHGRRLGISGNFLSAYVHQVQKLLGEVYPELVQNASLIEGVMKSEEDHFSQTLEAGRSLLFEALAKLSEGEVFSGDVAFTLHDTYGFPIDLTREIAEAKGHPTDMDAFNTAMEAQRARARAQVKDSVWKNATNIWVGLSEKLPASEFVGYTQNELDDAHVLAIVADGVVVDSVSAQGAAQSIELILDKTPFYAEKGGQVGDTGRLFSDAVELKVCDTKYRNSSLISHIVELTGGELKTGDRLSAQIDLQRRELIRRNHTATHLLDSALIYILGDHVKQAGSLLNDEYLRFDFTHFEALSAQQIQEIEDCVNAEIIAAKQVFTCETSYEEAQKMNPISLFGEKYGDMVRVVSVGGEERPFSRELCGGTHVRNSSEIGLFKIISEASIGSNLRRIEALTSKYALSYVNEHLQALNQCAHELKCAPLDLPARLEALETRLKKTQDELKRAKRGDRASEFDALLSKALDCGSYSCVFARFDDIGAKELREVWDALRDRTQKPLACVLASVQGEKIGLLAAANPSALEAGFKAGALIGKIAPLVDGRGGGKDMMAQAGGKNPAGLDAAFAEAKRLLQSQSSEDTAASKLAATSAQEPVPAQASVEAVQTQAQPASQVE